MKLMMRFVLAVISLMISSMLSSTGFAFDISGEVFEQNSNKSKKIYLYKNSSNPEESQMTIQFLDLNKQVVVEEKAQLNGINLIKYQIDHKQLGAKGSIEVKGDQIYFTRTMDGKEKSDSEKLESTLVVSANFAKFVKSHWSELMNKQDVDMRYGVWDRLETVGFTVSKVGEEVLDGKKAIKIKLKPTSFVIAALVKPVFIYFTEDGSRILILNGRVQPKLNQDGKWKDLDAEIYYSYN